MQDYGKVYEALRVALYARGVHLDPYTVMEAATLLARYLSRCDKPSLDGFEAMMKHALNKAGVALDLERVIREVGRLTGMGCDENHRLRNH